MSYCRFSSDNGRSDVYVYEHVHGGFTTHVAGRKRAFPPIPNIPMRWIPRLGGEFDKTSRTVVYPSWRHKMAARIVYGIWGRWRRLSMWSVGIIPLRDIGLPHDGETFSDETIAECIERLEALCRLGYHVPKSALAALRQEAAQP